MSNDICEHSLAWVVVEIEVRVLYEKIKIQNNEIELLSCFFGKTQN